MADQALLKKLGVKPGRTLAVIHAPDGFMKRVTPPARARDDGAGAGAAKHDIVQLFVKSQKELARDLGKATKALADGGILWIAYPKKTGAIATDLTRDIGWRIATEAGLEAVAVVSIDETWSSLRFKPAVARSKTTTAARNEKKTASKKTAVKPPPPKKTGPYAFSVKLLGPESGGICFFEFPYDVLETFGTRARVPVSGTVNGFPFRSSLSPMGAACHVMPINAELRAGAGCRDGDVVKVVLDRDTAPRTVDVPPDLARAMKKSGAAAALWGTLSYTHQKEYAQWITEAKKPETRERRVTQAIAMMEAGKRAR